MQWTLTCQTAGWRFSPWSGVPSLSKLWHQLHRTSQYYTGQHVLLWSKPGSRTSGRTLHLPGCTHSCPTPSFSLLHSLAIMVTKTALKKGTEWDKVNATQTVLRYNSHLIWHSDLLNYWTKKVTIKYQHNHLPADHLAEISSPSHNPDCLPRSARRRIQYCNTTKGRTAVSSLYSHLPHY